MQPTVLDIPTTDTIWQEVAESLGQGWAWTRAEGIDGNWRGSLQGPHDLRLFVRLNQPRWEIHQALDTVVRETGARIHTSYLYLPSEPKPVHSITVAKNRPAKAVAREIERRLLPSVRDILARLNRSKSEHVALATRRQQAVEAILRLVPSGHHDQSYNDDAPQLFLGPTVTLELRIDDADSITITRWSGLGLDTTLRLIATALDGMAPT